MEDVETAVRLKARLQGWKDYVGEQADLPPRADVVWPNADGQPIPEEPAYALIGEIVDDGPDGEVEPAARSVEDPRPDSVPKEVVDRVIEHWQTQIDDLRSSVAYERERARQIQDAMEREQMSRAVRLNLNPESADPSAETYSARIYSYDDSRVRTILLWVLLVLACGGIGVLYTLLGNR